MKNQRFNIGQSEEEGENQVEMETKPPEVNMQKLAVYILEKLRNELEIENERTGRS